MSNYDNVHKPAHYTEGRKFEPKDVIRDWNLGFNLGSAVKYISRAGRKDDIVQDLKKAQEFIQFEIDAIEEEHKQKLNADMAKFYVKHPNCRCSPSPTSTAKRIKDYEVKVPTGTPQSAIIQMAILELLGRE